MNSVWFHPVNEDCELRNFKRACLWWLLGPESSHTLSIFSLKAIPTASEYADRNRMGVLREIRSNLIMMKGFDYVQPWKKSKGVGVSCILYFLKVLVDQSLTLLETFNKLGV